LTASLPFILSLLLKTFVIFIDDSVERFNIRIGILFTCVLLLHDAYLLLNRSMKLFEEEQQLKQEIQNIRLSLMLSQIQPHFLYNALNTIQHLCTIDAKKAAEALEHFSKYLRGNMAYLTTHQLIPFSQELEHVRHYLYIEQLRFRDRVKVQYDLKITDFKLPTLTLQPLVENAIRYGVSKLPNGGTIRIHTDCIQDEIRISVTDDGAGPDSAHSSSPADMLALRM